MCDNLQYQHKEKLNSVFTTYGKFVFNHPWWFIIVPCVINVGLGFGLLRMETKSEIEQQYTPDPSTARENRDQVRSLFPIDTTSHFYRHKLADSGQYVSVIVEMVSGTNILNSSVWAGTIEPGLKTIYSYVNSTVATESGKSYMYNAICAKLSSACVVEGDLIFSQAFKNDLQAGSIHYPNYPYLGDTVYIDRIVGDVKINTNNIISATALKLIFNLESNRSDLSRHWEIEFIKRMETFSGTNLREKYAYSESLSDENTALVEDDQRKFIPVTYSLIIAISCLSLLKFKCKENRFTLGIAGIVGTALAILGSFGLISLCGVPFNNIAAAMPIPVLSIGVNYMLILLSCLVNTRSNESDEEKIGYIMGTGGISVTISSTIYVISYFAGASSEFPNVRNFSIYTGCAFLFVYITFITYFIGIISISIIKREGNSACNRFCRFESPESDRSESEGPIERYPKNLLVWSLEKMQIQIIVCVLLPIILGIAIWGTTEFKEDLDVKDLVKKDSYYYDYLNTDQRKFPQSLIISLNVNSKIDYKLNSTFSQIEKLISDLKTHNQFIDNDFLISWIHSYRSSDSYADSDDAAFIAGLKTFRGTADGSKFTEDILIETDNSISASRLYIRTNSLTSFSDQAVMMKEIRQMVDSSSLPVFAYAPEFVFREQYLEIRSETIRRTAISLGTILVVTVLFMPFLSLILLVTVNVVMVMVEVIGYAHFWGITLNSITLVPLFMCVGFCVEFSLHICHAFVKANDNDRKKRMKEAIDIAGGPICIGTFSSLIGVLVLAGSCSYIFFSFFKVMLFVLILGFFHSLFFIPVILMYFGPLTNNTENGDGNNIDGDDTMSLDRSVRSGITGASRVNVTSAL